MKTQNSLDEIASFLKQQNRLRSAQLYIGTKFYLTIPYPQNKTLIFKDKAAADEFINQLNISKL